MAPSHRMVVKEASQSWLTPWLSVTAAMLVLVNFVFDFKRRFDLTKERQHLDVLARRLGEDMDQYHFLASQPARQCQDLQTRLDEVNAMLRDLGQVFDALLRVSKTNMTTDTMQPDSASAHHAEDVGQPRLHSRRDGLLNVLEAPLAQLVSGLEAIRDHDLAEEYSKLGSFDQWNPGEILDQLQRRAGVFLPPNERQIIQLKIDSYRQACRFTNSQYVLGLAATKSDRIRDGDYLRPNANGEFDELVAFSGKEILATSLSGRGLLIWDKSTYPDLHRLDCLYKYIPMVMLEEVYNQLTERTER